MSGYRATPLHAQVIEEKVIRRRRSSILSPDNLYLQFQSIFCSPQSTKTAVMNTGVSGREENFEDDNQPFKGPIPMAKLNNGLEMPVIGLGTSEFQLKAGENTPKPVLDDVQAAVETAIGLGYRLFDTSYYCANEPQVGKALQNKIQQNVVKREDLFVTTKLWSTFHHPSRVLQGLQKSLQNLGLTYLDCFLIHTPVGFKYVDDDTRYPADEHGAVLFEPVDHVEIWREMEKAVDQGLTKSIGLSNFNQAQIQHVLDNCRIKPAVLEIENHAYFMQNDLFQFAQSNGITVVAYAPIGSPARWFREHNEPALYDDPVVAEIAHRFDIPPSKILLRYLIERGRCVIPHSVGRNHLMSNLEMFRFGLSEDDLGRLDQLDRNQRYFQLEALRKSPEYPF